MNLCLEALSLRGIETQGHPRDELSGCVRKEGWVDGLKGKLPFEVIFGVDSGEGKAYPQDQDEGYDNEKKWPSVTNQARKEGDEEDTAPDVGEMQIDGQKLRGVPHGFRIPSLCDGVGEGIVSEDLWNQGRKEENEVE